MSNVQKWLLVLAAIIAAVGILLGGLDRYVWVPGQNDIHGVDYLPKILDTWSGKSKFAVES